MYSQETDSDQGETGIGKIEKSGKSGKSGKWNRIQKWKINRLKVIANDSKRQRLVSSQENGRGAGFKIYI